MDHRILHDRLYDQIRHMISQQLLIHQIHLITDPTVKPELLDQHIIFHRLELIL